MSNYRQPKRAYLASYQLPDVREPFWFVVTQPKGETYWFGICPVEWLSEEQRNKLSPDVTAMCSVTFEQGAKEATVYFDKPVMVECIALRDEIEVVIFDAVYNNLVIDRGYGWEFRAN